MALIVENGTGLADADALISVSFADSYHAARGNATWAGVESVKEVAIRRASAYLTDAYKWVGYRLKGRDQALAWPRVGAVDREGCSVESSEIPVEIQNACAEIALRELVAPGSLTPDVTPSERVKRERIGPIEIEYENSRIDDNANRPVLLAVRDMISQFLAIGSGTTLAGSVYRV